MAEGANGSNGAYGSQPSDPNEQQQQQQGSNPDSPLKKFITGIAGSTSKSFVTPIAKGMGESIRDMLMGPGGRREERREEGVEDKGREEQQSENIKEQGAEKGTVFQAATDAANAGRPITPEMENGLQQMGVHPSVINMMKGLAQQAQQGQQQFLKDFQSGAFGDPNDPNLRGSVATVMESMTNPATAKGMAELQKLINTKAAIQTRGAVSQTTERMKDNLQLIRHEKESAFNTGERSALMDKGEALREKGMGVAEGLREHGMGVSAALKGTGSDKAAAAAQAKAVASVDATIRGLETGKMGATKIPTDFASATSMLSDANTAAIQANPKMSGIDAVNKLGFALPGSPGGTFSAPGKPIVGKGLSDTLQKYAGMNPDVAPKFNRFLRMWHENLEGLKSKGGEKRPAGDADNKMAQLLVEGTKMFPDNIRQAILQQAMQMGQTLSDSQSAGSLDTSPDAGASAPLAGEDDSGDSSNIMQPMPGDSDASDN